TSERSEESSKRTERNLPRRRASHCPLRSFITGPLAILGKRFPDFDERGQIKPTNCPSRTSFLACWFSMKKAAKLAIESNVDTVGTYGTHAERRSLVGKVLRLPLNRSDDRGARRREPHPSLNVEASVPA